MKTPSCPARVILFVAALVIGFQPSTGQWTQWQSGTSSYLNGVSFLDSSRGLIVGGGGTIRRTTDAGVSWIPCVGGTGELLKVAFADSLNAVAVGWTGTLLRTANGGETWSQEFSGTTEHLHDVAFFDSVRGLIVGTG